MVLSLFGARLVQLQGIDPKSYAAMAAAEGLVRVTLPAERGDILDRNGEPLADSVDGLMVVADPYMTTDEAPELAKFLATRLDVDYFRTLQLLREKGSRFEYVARRVPSTLATDVVSAARQAGFEGLDTPPTRSATTRPATSPPTCRLRRHRRGARRPRAHLRHQLSGTDGSSATRSAAATGSRSATARTSAGRRPGPPTTIDRDLQWYTQRVLRQTVEDARATPASRSSWTPHRRVLALADHPTFDAATPRPRQATAVRAR
jgi:cell division protein FtsI (penicillin-binding protein 3)